MSYPTVEVTGFGPKRPWVIELLSREQLPVNKSVSRVRIPSGLSGIIEAWAGCANKCLRFVFSNEMFSSSREELRDFLILQTYRVMARISGVRAKSKIIEALHLVHCRTLHLLRVDI